jgi:hypothetical protein
VRSALNLFNFAIKFALCGISRITITSSFARGNAQRHTAPPLDAARFGADHLCAGALSPDFQLLNRRRAERSISPQWQRSFTIGTPEPIFQ